MSDPCSGWEFLANSWEFLTKHSESLRNLALTVVALFAIPTAIWRTVAANRSSWAAARSSEAAARQAETGVQTHITQNFTKAVEQLGSDKLDVRLGAIYALARIAQDSERDYWPIMQTLTAYVRERRPRSTDTQSLETEKGETTPPEIPVDIQSVIAVLGSRKHEYEKPHQIPDLSNTDLQGLTLDTLGENYLGHINFQKSDLREAFLFGVDLRGASLFDADLRGAFLDEVDLREASLSMADLDGANLSGAKNLTCEQLTSARNWESAYRDTALVSLNINNVRNSEYLLYPKFTAHVFRTIGAFCNWSRSIQSAWRSDHCTRAMPP